MNYLGKVELFELDCEKDFFLVRNELNGKAVYIYDDNLNKNLKLDGIFLYNVLNVRDGKEVSIGFSTLEKYNLFLLLRKGIKGTGSKIISRFACLSKFEQKEILDGNKKMKGLGESNLIKLKKIYTIENNNEIDKFNEIKTFLKDISTDEELQNNFLNEKFDKIKEMSKVEILEEFNKF